MLKLKNISCGYQEKCILQNITLNLGQKKIIGIIGPNGSGKTTLLRAITKVIPLLAGQIMLQGKDIACMGYKELAESIAVASNDLELQFDISVEDFVALGRIPHQKPLQFFESSYDKTIIHQALEMTEIVQLKARSMRDLSAGERQLAIIAKALAQEPKLLLLDEPVVHLDISHQVYILDLIKRLHKEKALSVIIVLHELNLASEYCDALVLLNKGRVHTQGTSEQVLTREIIEQAYKTEVVIDKNPVSGKPYLFMVSEEAKTGRKR